MKRIVLAAAAMMALASRADMREEMWEKPVELREGVVIRAYALDKPRIMKAYVVRVDLSTPGIGFAATERAPGWGERMKDVKKGTCLVETRLEKTVDFMKRKRLSGANVEVAFNTTPWRPFPAPAGNVTADPDGWCVADGVEVSTPVGTHALFLVRKDGTAEIADTVPPDGVRDIAFAAGGFSRILKDGKIANLGAPTPSRLHPRMAVGLTADRKTLVILAVDGRQRGYSLGADMADLCAIFLREGVSDAVNMDGGGSTSLVVWDRKNARPWMLNRHASGKMRANAANLGIVFR